MVVAGMPTLNAQQESPNQTTATQQNAKPKAAPMRTFPQPRGQPTQAPTGNSNPTRDKRIAKNPGPGKPAVNNAGNGKTSDNSNYEDAKRSYRHERHDCDWWKQHYVVIVLVGGGYYYQDSGYWYPALGYDLNHERYDYDGPLYTYGNLLPDQVIINVQRALKELGYYAGDLNGSLGIDTREELSAYHQAFELDTTGALDQLPVPALAVLYPGPA